MLFSYLKKVPFSDLCEIAHISSIPSVFFGSDEILIFVKKFTVNEIFSFKFKHHITIILHIISYSMMLK